MILSETLPLLVFILLTLIMRELDSCLRSLYSELLGSQKLTYMKIDKVVMILKVYIPYKVTALQLPSGGLILHHAQTNRHLLCPNFHLPQHGTAY